MHVNYASVCSDTASIKALYAACSPEGSMVCWSLCGCLVRAFRMKGRLIIPCGLYELMWLALAALHTYMTL